jgi:hypothetical protein
MRSFGSTRCEAMRRKGSAATPASQKNLILPQDKFANTRCLQFAARLVGRVNVRDLRESQIERKCFSRCQIPCRTMRSAFCASRANASQAIEQVSEFLRSHNDCARYSAQALPSARLFAPNNAPRSRKTPPTAIGLPQRARFSPQDSAGSRAIPQCGLSASTDAGFRRDPIPQS